MSGFLTTHVLDTANGVPASGMEIDLFRIRGEERIQVASTTTNSDGRTDAPILPEDEFEVGSYELVFHVGGYFRVESGFLGEVPVRFGMSEESHYHVPLLVSPYSYSTYRGS